MMTGKHETFMVVTSARHDSSLLVVVVVVVLVVHILSHFVGLARQITRAQMNERKTVQREKEKRNKINAANANADTRKRRQRKWIRTILPFLSL